MFGSEPSRQFSIFRTDHQRARQDREGRHGPADSQACSEAPRQHFAEVGEIDGVTDSGADAGGDEGLMVSCAYFWEAA